MSQLCTPKVYQHIIVDHIFTYARCAIWAGMGLGKTYSILRALSFLSLVEDVYPALVLAPLRVAQSTWPDEVAKWKDFEHMTICAVVGDEQARTAALKRAADIYTINYENLPWLVEHYGGEWPFKTVISDESTKLKGFRLRQGTKRAKALAKVAHTKVKRFIELTGTPSPNGLADLWGQMWFVDAGVRLGRTFDSFRQRWFQMSFDGFGMTALAHAQEEIADKLRDVCLSLNAADYFDLHDPISNTIYIDLPKKARALYTDMERRMFMELEGHGIEAPNAAAKTMKCLQVCSGAAYIDPDKEYDENEELKPVSKTKEWKEIHDEKIKALESIIEEAAGMPVLVAYHFRSDLERLRKAFPKGRVLDNNPQTIRDWNAGKIPILFAHPASAGHGLNLQDGGNILVFFTVNWNLEEHQQIIERIGPVRQLQAGHNRAMFIYYILARSTTDELVVDRLTTKRSVQDILREAIKYRELV